MSPHLGLGIVNNPGRGQNFQQHRGLNQGGQGNQNERVPQPHVDFSVDDGGMDEYDVAEEH